jgi:putative efflux protein, MATE family
LDKKISIIDENKTPLSIIITLALPILLENILMSLVNAVDTAMVGSLGATATAGVSINQAPMMLINGVVMSFGMGFTILIARNVGAENNERAKHLIRQAIITVVALGTPLAVLFYALAEKIPMWMGGEAEILQAAATYNRIIATCMMFRSLMMVLTAIYRGYGDSRTPLIMNTFINALNVVGNYILIFETHNVNIFGNEITVFGAGLGVAGAAISTAASTILGAFILLALLFIRKTPMQISLKDSFTPDFKELQNVAKISLPAMFERFTMSGASVIVASTVASLGTVAIASNSLAGTAESISFMPGFAFGMAITTLVGQSLGAGKEELAEEFVSLTKKLGAAVMFITGLGLFVFSAQIIGIFTPDERVIQLGSDALKILAVIQVPQVLATIYSGALRGAGDTKGTFIITLISMWGVRILGSIITVRVLHFGLLAVLVSMCTDNVVRFVLFHFRYKKGKWKTTLRGGN